MLEFFKIFPFFAGDYFYITVFALIYWMGDSKRKLLAVELIYLVLFSTMICYILKNIFAIPRPPIEGQLVKVWEQFGFPSGDVLVAAAFWGILSMRTKIKVLYIFAPILVLLIAISRVCLGVHSILDVTAGFFIGVAIIFLWNGAFVQRELAKWMNGKSKSFWFMMLVSIALCYVFVSDKGCYYIFASVIGVLAAIEIAIMSGVLQKFTDRMSWFRSIIMLVITIALVKYIPFVKDNVLLLCITSTLKYGVGTMFIVWIAPKINFCLLRRTML